MQESSSYLQALHAESHEYRLDVFNIVYDRNWIGGESSRHV